MHFLKQFFSRSTNTNRRILNKRTKPLSLESLEQRIALDASGSPIPDAVHERPELKATTSLLLTPDSWGPSPVTIDIDILKGAVEAGDENMSYVITNVANGYVEKYDGQNWVNVSQTPASSNPRELLKLLSLREIRPTDQLRWVPSVYKETSVRSFSFVGWDGKKSSNEVASVEASVPNLQGEIYVEQEIYGGEYSIMTDGTVSLKVDLAPYALWSDEGGDLGYNNFNFIYDSYDQLTDENGYVRVGLAIENGVVEDADDQFFVVNLTEPPVYIGNDALEFVGSLETNIAAGSTLAGLFGEEMSMRHNQFRGGSALLVMNDGRQGANLRGNSRIIIDTYTEAEYLGSTNAYEYGEMFMSPFALNLVGGSANLVM
jgi:hypothetical protein